MAHRKRFEPNVNSRPAWVLQDRTLAAALRATGRPSKHVARCVRHPTDYERHERHRRAVQALLADHPAPRRAAAELLEGWGCRRCVHAGENDDIRAGVTAARGGGLV